jgi:Arc/MetJ-type ribon-helix-helix transcriptional regulator
VNCLTVRQRSVLVWTLGIAILVEAATIARGKVEGTIMDSNLLSPETEQFVQNLVLGGTYHDRAEVLDRAVELLRRREQLVRDVNEGVAQPEHGEGVPLDIEAIKTTVRRQLETP